MGRGARLDVRAEPPALDDVAFCRDREKPVFRHGFSGPIAGLSGHIVNFTYSTYETRRAAGATASMETYSEEVKHHHTVLRLELGDLGLHSLQLSPQSLGGGMLEKLRSAFTGSRSSTWRAGVQRAATRCWSRTRRTT